MTVLIVFLCPFAVRGVALPQEVTVDTLAGGRIVVTNPSRTQGGGSVGWRLVEDLRLGRVEGSGPDIFAEIRDIAVGENGLIYVLDVGWKEVRVFSREGRYLRRMARAGGGPGEKRYGSRIDQDVVWQAPNRLWVGDGRQQLSLDSLGNELHRSDRRAGFWPGNVPIWGRVIDADTLGFVYKEVTLVDYRTPDRDYLRHTYAVRHSVSGDHELLAGDTLLIETRFVTMGPPESSTTEDGRGELIMSWPSFMAPQQFVWGFGSVGTLWVAHRSAYRFHEVTFDRDTVRTVALGDPAPVANDAGGESGFEPIIAALDVSPEGWLWVRRESAGPEAGATWDLFDNCGRYRGEVGTPVRLGAIEHPRGLLGPRVPLEIAADGVVLGIVSDALGVDSVIRLRLQSAAGTRVARETCLF
ncbi:hypothetical protein [Candidatus Palauibacter sp.]|uniref:hypothetical protein n=1 Tax=Candidatus Palauibacter sp. TaxID=3101350 RepID=UPI003AF26F2D